METKLKIAVQKSGRLNEGSLELLKNCGISVNNTRKEKLKAEASNYPLEVLFLRNDDIPQYIADGVADAGIIGENVVIEKQRNIEIVEKLGFAKCRLSMAIPKNEEYTGLAYFQGKRIATSYPNTLKQFLKDNQIEADVHIISGSVEIAPSIGLADAICDLVSSGGTLFGNNLKEVETLLYSESVIAARPNLSTVKQDLLDRLLFRIQAINRAKKANYLILNAPNDSIDNICTLLPGLKSPTITPLKEAGWSAVHTVVYEDTFWDVIDKLKKYNAEGILVVPVEKMF